MMKKREMRKQMKKHTVFSTIFGAMLIVLGIELSLLVSTMALGHVPRQLNENAEEILLQQVENRSSYLENFLVDAQELSILAGKVNEVTQELLASGEISLDTLSSGSAHCEPLLKAVGATMIEQMRTKRVNGIFIVLNTNDLDACKEGTHLPGLYLRDLDPEGPYSDRNDDLAIEFGPAALVQSMNIYTEQAWQPTYSYLRQNADFIYAPFQAAYQDGGKLDAEEYGRWTTTPFRLPDDKRDALAYSQPLILPDGTVYGVIGVSMLCCYLEERIPSGELQNAEKGTYLLVNTTDDVRDEMHLNISVSSTRDTAMAAQTTMTLQPGEEEHTHTVFLNGKRYYACTQQLKLYNRNAPFSQEKWLLVGLVPTTQLYHFSQTVQEMLAITVILTIASGLFGSLMVAGRLARPISRLSKQVAAAQEDSGAIPTLSPTGIKEMDQFSDAFTQRSQAILDTSTKFLRIMRMASMEMGGYERREDSELVYVTDNFFTLLDVPVIPREELTRSAFDALLAELLRTHQVAYNVLGGTVVTIPLPEGEKRYVLLQSAEENGVLVGLVEDVTSAMLERRRIEHERDFDVLTGLYNRFSFERLTSELFANPEKLGHAALLMADLDNLKGINDTYGHDWGDRYICLAGRCFRENAPANSVYARMSGDEFVMLLYGYESDEKLRVDLSRIQKAAKSYSAELPNGESMRISMSGGVAWYPQDGQDMKTLKRFADFALYQVKRRGKDDICDFDMGAYLQEAHQVQLQREFLHIIAERDMNYHFQPILSAKTGNVYAYEALMRVNQELLKSPAQVMKLAREMDQLYAVEKLTFFRAAECFEALRHQGDVQGDAKLFINSIANAVMTDEDVLFFRQRFPWVIDKLVVEITEEEDSREDVLDIKRRQLGENAVFALDDYGSGYSNSNQLLRLAPKYIKVDISIVRDIDTSLDRQQMIVDLITYAHARKMLVVAEGVETASELRKLIGLGVDLLQGYFLVRPATIPAQISDEAVRIIREMNE